MTLNNLFKNQEILPKERYNSGSVADIITLAMRQLSKKSVGKLISFQTSPDLETYTHLLRVRIKDANLRSGMIASAKFILQEINSYKPLYFFLNEGKLKSELKLSSNFSFAAAIIAVQS